MGREIREGRKEMKRKGMRKFNETMNGRRNKIVKGMKEKVEKRNRNE